METTIPLTEREIKILAELRSNIEGDADKNGYYPVCLGNCDSEGSKGWNGILSSLTKKGMYKPENDGDFGGYYGYVKK